MTEEPTMTITLKKWKRIQARLDLLDHLEANGVDNWEGYSTPDDEDDHEECEHCGEEHPTAVLENGLCPACGDLFPDEEE